MSDYIIQRVLYSPHSDIPNSVPRDGAPTYMAWDLLKEVYYPTFVKANAAQFLTKPRAEYEASSLHSEHPSEEGISYLYVVIKGD